MVRSATVMATRRSAGPERSQHRALGGPRLREPHVHVEAVRAEKPPDALAVSRGDERPGCNSAPWRRPSPTLHARNVAGLYPLIAPDVSPATICRLKNTYMTSGGMVMSRMAMKSRCHDVWYWPKKLYNVNWTVAFSSPGAKYSGFVKSLKTNTACTTTTVTMTPRSSGKMTPKNRRSGPAPSRMAASSSSRGIVDTKARNSSTANGRPNAISTVISPGTDLKMPSSCITQIVGTTASGTISPARTKKLTRPVSREARRCNTQPTIAARTTQTVTDTTVTMVLLMNAVTRR